MRGRILLGRYTAHRVLLSLFKTSFSRCSKHFIEEYDLNKLWFILQVETNLK